MGYDEHMPFFLKRGRAELLVETSNLKGLGFRVGVGGNVLGSLLGSSGHCTVKLGYSL